MSDFERALEYVLKVEGGRIDSPHDPGGKTAFGITHRTYDKFRTKHDLPQRDVFEIEPHEVKSIYHNDYWVASKADKLRWPLSLIHFDGWVQHRPEIAAVLLQRAVGTTPDGIIGPKTLAAARESSRPVAELRLMLERMCFYAQLAKTRPALRPNFRGWINRLVTLREEAGL